MNMMDINDVKINLEALYIDYYDGLYSEQQLKLMLMKIFHNSDISVDKWSELVLDAQWKHATEADFEAKRAQLAKEYLNEEN